MKLTPRQNGWKGRDGHDRSNHKGLRDEGSVGNVGDARVVECLG